MSLSDLPEEVVAMVVDYCPLKQRAALWEAGGAARSAMQHYGAGRLRLQTASDLWTLRSRNQPLARVLELVQVLNVRNAPLYKTVVLPIIRRMKNLRALDLSNTPTRLEHVVLICGSLPRLTRLTIDLNNSLIPERVFITAKKSLQYLEYVHVIGLFDSLFCSDTNLSLLRHANLKELKLTASVDEHIGDTLECLSEDRFVLEGSYKTFSLHLINCAVYGVNFRHVLAKLCRDFNGWEFITVEKISTDPKVMMGAKFLDAAKRQGSCSVLPFVADAPLSLQSRESLSIFAWHPDLANNSGQFYERIVRNILTRIPQFVCVASDDRMEEKKSFIIHPCIVDLEADQSHLNLAQFVKRKERMSVTIKGDCRCPSDPSLPAVFSDKVPELLASPRFINLEFLSISNLSRKSTFDKNFFKNLFTDCCYLATLNFENNDYMCVVETVKYSKSLRNLRIESDGINLSELFLALTAYKLLESVQICDSKSWPEAHLMISADSQWYVYEFIEVSSNLHNLQVYKKFIDSEDEYLFTESIKSRLRLRSLKLNLDVAEPPFPYDSFSRVFIDHHNLSDCDLNKNIHITSDLDTLKH